jgi:hypothetical protein
MTDPTAPSAAVVTLPAVAVTCLGKDHTRASVPRLGAERIEPLNRMS